MKVANHSTLLYTRVVPDIRCAGYWHFLMSGPDPDPVNRLPDIRNPARAGYPEFGHMSDAYLNKYL